MLTDAPAAQSGEATEHFDELRATLKGAHTIMDGVSAIERRIGPLGSHARGYTHKLTKALRHLDALQALATHHLAQPAEAVEALRELFALVKGECPSLLNEDSGGDGALCLRIEDALAAAHPTEQRIQAQGRDEVTDRELLELAAKAAGFEIVVQRTTDRLWDVRDGKQMRGWNSIVDDGDALRLAVKLNLTIQYDTLPDGAIVQVGAPWHDQFPNYWWNEWLGADPNAATRRAIVRAAAEIELSKS
jgi:hypothetical protein